MDGKLDMAVVPRRRRRRLLGGALAFVLVALSSAVMAPVAGSLEDEPPDWLLDLLGVDLDEVQSLPMDEVLALVDEGSYSAEEVLSEGTEPLSRNGLPEPGAWAVAVAGEGLAEPLEGETPGPVEVALDDDGALAGAAEGELTLEVLGADAAAALGASAFAFTVEDADAAGDRGLLAEAAEAAAGEVTDAGADTEPVLPVELSVDYSSFSELYGGGFIDRARVVAFPACVAEEPRPAGCDVAGTSLPLTVDHEAERLVVEVEDLGALASQGVGDLEISEGLEGRALDDAAPTGDDSDLADELGEETDAGSGDRGAPDWGGFAGNESGVMFAVTSSPSGDSGSFAASDLSGSNQWQVSPGSGEFSFGYGMDVPAPAAGDAPQVGTGYSSGAVDGLTLSSQPQGSKVGLGWSNFDDAFIERRYEPCLQRDSAWDTPDLCWMTWNATLSLGGASGMMVPIDDDVYEWRVTNDTGWRVERLTGASNGVWEGEHWKVTALDGTEYWFGLGRAPNSNAETRSALRVPVIGDHPGEPCHGSNEFDVCHSMGYRWNLDRVVDPDGNMTVYSYVRDGNRYRAVAGYGGNPAYHASSVLDRIDYGVRDGADATVRVEFGRQYRCNDLNGSCERPRTDNAEKYPDVPNDLVCRNVPGVTFPCTSNSPSFYDVWRYSHVKTEVRVGSEWRPVNQWNLAHSLQFSCLWVGGGQQEGMAADAEADPALVDLGDEDVAMQGATRPPGFPTWNEDRDTCRMFQGVPTATSLQLRAVQRNGVVDGGWVIQEPTEFSYRWLPNRVDGGCEFYCEGAMWFGRLRGIDGPYGGATTVQYGWNRRCAEDYRPQWWHQNDRDCFPQSSIDDQRQRTGVFHKYLTAGVIADPGDGSPEIETRYRYHGDPGWVFNYGAFAQYDHEWGWANWRGYGEATTEQDDARHRVRVFRGMDGDPLMAIPPGGGQPCPCGEREAEVESFDGARSFTDHPALAGRTVEDADAADPLQADTRTLYEYGHEVTHDAADDPSGIQNLVDPEWADVERITEYVRTDEGDYRLRGSETTYNDHLLPESTVEMGWLDEDERRCSTTTYATDEDRWMLAYPSSNLTVAGDCDSGEVLAASETYYDGIDTLGELGDRGNPTRQRSQIDEETWAESTTEFDDLGRPVAATDALGETTTSSYEASPAHAVPTATEITNALGHTERTEYLPELGVPLRQIGVNGNETTYAYDALGRLTEVWVPSHQGGDPSSRFLYFPQEDRRMVWSMTLIGEDASGNAQYDHSFAVHDGFWRPRQSQVLSPTEGLLLVSETTYDSRGQVRDQTAPQPVEMEGDGLLEGYGKYIDVDEWDNRDRTIYDDQGRVIESQFWQGTDAERTTTYDYGHDTVTVTGPEGHQVRETLDGFGRTVEMAEHDGDEWVTSEYGYGPAGELASVTDPAGNTISYTYNIGGWKLTQDDPNRGTASFGYDGAGQMTRVTDGNGNEVHVSYDALGRTLERRAGSPDGELLASWDYDGAENGLGRAHRETRYTDEGEWVSETVDYDEGGRSLGSRLTVPDSLPGGLGGEYEITKGYDVAGRVLSVTYPEIGGLPAETLTTSYDDLGLARSMSGLEDYVWGVDYDDRGRPVAAGYGPQPGGEPWLAKSWEYNANQQATAMETWVADSQAGGTVSRYDLTFDRAGNLETRDVSMNGAEWSECHDYDGRQRLVESYTVDDGEECGAGEPGGGPRPYHHSYRYSEDGNLLERVEDGNTVSYLYPDPGDDRPHAPTEIDGEVYEWDDNGNLIERSSAEETELFDWDVEGRLASVEDDDGTTSFVYDAGGQRLVRETDDALTLYIGSHEITAPKSGQGSVSGVRNYSFGGELVAIRHSELGMSYLVSDDAGSIEMEIAEEGDVSGTRTYGPYGSVRDEDGDELTTDRGFLGQVEDDSTDLSYLNARYYDTEAAVFISTDPIYDTQRPKTLNPYSYGGGNPTTYTDPSGLSPSYRFGLERTVMALQGQNKKLMGHIDTLQGEIKNLQGIIKDQNRAMNRMMQAISALESIIRQQQSLIVKMQARIRKLEQIVAAQAAEINRLHGVIRRQQQIINAQAAEIKRQQLVINQQAATIAQQRRTINYYRGVVDDFGLELFGWEYYTGGTYDVVHTGGWDTSDPNRFDNARTTQMASEIEGLKGQVSGLESQLGGSMNLEQYEEWKGIANLRVGSDEWTDLVLDGRGAYDGLAGEVVEDAMFIQWLQRRNRDQKMELDSLRAMSDLPGSEEPWGWVDTACDVVGIADTIVSETKLAKDKRIKGVMMIANGVCTVAG